jgi:signal transduction histidine kinase
LRKTAWWGWEDSNFQPNDYQPLADNAITRKKGGTGLGLPVSKRIIEMHGSRIWVESQVGQGSTFAFTLPVIVEQQVGPA